MTNSNIIHWNQFYNDDVKLDFPSPFAIWISDNFIVNIECVIDIGCGTGRDTLHFYRKNRRVIGLDTSEVAISVNRERCGDPAIFRVGDISVLCEEDSFFRNRGPLLSYSRFFLHAITEVEQSNVLQKIDSLSVSGDICAHEFRTPRDPLFYKGTIISSNERQDGHYRRFIEPRDFCKLLGPNWKVVYMEESDNFAVLGEDAPTVCRIVARKK